MSSAPNKNIPSGNVGSEGNVLTGKEKTKIWQELFEYQVRVGPHPDDYPSIKHRLHRDLILIILTVNSTLRKIGGPSTSGITTERVNEGLDVIATGKRHKKAINWARQNVGSLSGWLVAIVLGATTWITLTRPVIVQAPRTEPPIVIERERLPLDLYFLKVGSDVKFWEGSGNPGRADAEGRWVEINMIKVPHVEK